MAMRCTKEGQVQLETELLSSGENWLLCLYKTAHTPSVLDVAATMTAIESTVSGYARKTLTRTISGATWQTVSSTGNTIDAVNLNAKAVYGATAPIFNFSGTETEQGYFLLGATSGKLIFLESFLAPFNVTNGSSITVPFQLEVASDTH